MDSLAEQHGSHFSRHRKVMRNERTAEKEQALRKPQTCTRGPAGKAGLLVTADLTSHCVYIGLESP